METQEYVTHVTGVPRNRINAGVKRMGRAFGGKESRSVPIACVLAIVTKKEKCPIRCMLKMNDGTLQALDIDIYNNGGYSLDMSGAAMNRACTHVYNCYEISHGHICTMALSESPQGHRRRSLPSHTCLLLLKVSISPSMNPG